MKYFLFFISPFLLLSSCIKQEALRVPKPVGYFRIEIPENEYVVFDTLLPFTFDIHPSTERLIKAQDDGSYWLDINYTNFSATINMTYIPIKDNLRTLVLEENKMVMFHVDQRMAEDVIPSVISSPNDNIFGQIFELEGKKVASTMQFWLTDSVNHYVRGSLYFNFAQNNDSLVPVISYLQDEIINMVNTWEWKDSDVKKDSLK